MALSRTGVGMSSRLRIAFPVALLLAAPAFAQQVEEPVGGLDIYGPPPDLEDCSAEQEAAAITGEIVVCRRRADDSRFRIRSEEDAEDDYADRTKYANDPQAPDVTGPGIFRGPATASGCIPGVTCPPPMPIMIDLKAIPEAPAGSDADRVARGLAPRGGDGPVVEAEPVAPEEAVSEPG